MSTPQVGGENQGDTQLPVKTGKTQGGGRAQKLDGCNFKNLAKWALVALAVAALIPGFAGLIVYFGKIPSFLSFLGQFSKTQGMWASAGGFLTTATGTAGAVILGCWSKKGATTHRAGAAAPSWWQNCCKKTATQNP